MSPSEIEKKYGPKVRQIGSLLLLSTEHALSLLDDCSASPVRFLGVEAFRVYDDGGVQPAMEFSNISFGTLPPPGTEETFEFKRGPRPGWKGNIDALLETKELIQRGALEGCTWYEVSLEDPETESLLFFGESNA